MRIRKVKPSDINNLTVLATQIWLDTYAITGIRGAISTYVLSELMPERFASLLAYR